MADSNQSPDTSAAGQSQLKRASILTGLVAGLAVPSIFIVYVYVRTQIAFAQHPLGPGEGRCGTGPVMLIVTALFSSPFFGAIGAFLGWQHAKEISDT